MKTMIASLLAFSSVAFAAATVCDVRDYGASGNGRAKDTQAIQKAIEACAQKAGVVYFSPGNYLTGAITLRSNITLHIEAGATLLGSPDAADYPMVPNPWRPETTTISALIYGDGVKNVTLTGLGTIDGQGLTWWKRAFIWRRSPEYESRERHYTPLVEMCSLTPSMNTALSTLPVNWRGPWRPGLKRAYARVLGGACSRASVHEPAHGGIDGPEFAQLDDKPGFQRASRVPRPHHRRPDRLSQHGPLRPGILP